MNATLLFLIPLAPLFCGIFNALFGIRIPRRISEGLAVAGVASSAVATLLLWPAASGEGLRATLYTWLESGDLTVPVELLFDPLSAIMALMVALVSTLIHVYAVAYMREEPDYARFFALLNLFVFAMLTIVLADNLLVLFLGWEGVGFCSYALIGYWYRKEANASAGRKAFLVTRVGDVFFGVALLWLFSLTGTLSVTEVNAQAAHLPAATVTTLALLLLLGACGKSAQIPLMTWLPDAMAGPTPVSALIHAATMVTAGVYLLCRLFPLVSLSPVALAAVATVGAATALYAATCALAQQEIKRVLAYSTMSQVGYMFLAVGAGSVSGALFHLVTHAFFKAALFMGAGCVIHLAASENDIFRMGGMAKRSRPVFLLFFAAALCLAGVPLTGGFFSKDAILLALFAHGDPFHRLLWISALVTAAVTAAYTFRLLYLVFAGEHRGHGHPHPLPASMVATAFPLALFGLAGGVLDLPATFGGDAWLSRFLSAGAEPESLTHLEELIVATASVVAVLAGWLVAHARWSAFSPSGDERRNRFLLQGWRADALVTCLVTRPFAVLARVFWEKIDIGTIDAALERSTDGFHRGGEVLRRLTTGRLSSYLTAFACGVLLIIGWMLWLRFGM